MAWHSGKPADGDLLSASAQYIRENFAELEPLHPHVAELTDLTALHPYIDALISSRIVDHNLDVANPPNGWYVRWENGLQVCFGWVAVFTGDGTSEEKSGTLPLPASFSAGAALWAGNEFRQWRIYQDTELSSVTIAFPWRAERKVGTWFPGTDYLIHFIAVGRWK